MAPLTPNVTQRYWLDYTTGITEHSAMIRIGEGGGDAQALSFFSQFLAALQPVLSDEFAVLGVRRAALGSNVSFPVAIGALSTFTGTDTDSPLPVDAPKEFVWVGRGIVTGRRWKLSMYGIQLPFPPDYRYSGPIFPTGLGDAIDVLQEFDGIIVAIDGGPITVYEYVNVNNNSYWESEART